MTSKRPALGPGTPMPKYLPHAEQPLSLGGHPVPQVVGVGGPCQHLAEGGGPRGHVLPCAEVGLQACGLWSGLTEGPATVTGWTGPGVGGCGAGGGGWVGWHFPCEGGGHLALRQRLLFASRGTLEAIEAGRRPLGPGPTCFLGCVGGQGSGRGEKRKAL